jgi:predicted acyltransferase
MLAAYTILHVIISLIGIVTGFIVMAGMYTSQYNPSLTKTFLIFTILTSLTGFFFPFHGFKPSYVIGVLSLIALAIAWIALYKHRLAGKWRWIYVVSAIVAQWFNFFVVVAQSFMKIPALHAFAPNGNEPPFAVTELFVMLFFAAFAILAVKKFRPGNEGAV